MKSLSQKFRDMAEKLVAKIEHGRRLLSQNPTPKRMREYRGRCHDAGNLDRTRRAMLAMASAIDTGNLPDCLSHVKTQKDIAPLVHKGTLGGGYYDVLPDPDYRDNTEAGKALQRMIDSVQTPEEKLKQEAVSKAQKIQNMEDRLRWSDIPGFFPTPPATIARMLELAGIQEGMEVLEPSAGNGAIADAMKQFDPLCIEIRPSLREILTEKGHRVSSCYDFMEFHSEAGFDRIVMNPPFENGQDAEHIRHAFDCLKSGGRLVAIAGEGIWFRSDRQIFREWLEDQDYTSDRLPPDWCKGGGVFRPTGVAGRILVIDKIR